MKRIGILTSSRADFGIYLPLLKALKENANFQTRIIAFGTHLSAFHGYTLTQIEEAGFTAEYKIESMLLTDSSSAIATSMGLTLIKFADFWQEHAAEFDLVFCLGDRYEMFSAVTAGIPFQVQFAHLHGGETTLGAIDNVFRHGITLASRYHFVSTPTYATRVEQIINGNKNIFYVGALGLDNLIDFDGLTIQQFDEKWGIDLSRKTILVTYHPETVAYQDNAANTQEFIKAIEKLADYQVLITMPNADTAGSSIRKMITERWSNSDRFFLIENLGAVSYFTAMKHCAFLLGNTSSGIIEAASFGKFVINIGDRQKGRASGDNVIHVPINADAILNAVHSIKGKGHTDTSNIYYNNGAAAKIIEALEQI